MGEFYIETGLSTIGMSDYKRILSLDSALAIVQFNKDGVAYERNYFISYPNNVMTIRFKANKPGKQNLVFSYEPNPVSTGKMETNGNMGWFILHVWTITKWNMSFVFMQQPREVHFLTKAAS